jgi:Rieske Fe-S protein
MVRGEGFSLTDFDDCDECPLTSRRYFVRNVVGSVVLAFGALGSVGAPAAAASVTLIRGQGDRADKSYQIPPADGVAIDKDESVIIAHVENRVYAFSLACPHQNTAIRWEALGHRFQCPKHKSRYRPDGTFVEGRATRGLDRFALRRDGDRVLVNLDDLFRQDENASQWASAFVELVASEK